MEADLLFFGQHQYHYSWSDLPASLMIWELILKHFHLLTSCPPLVPERGKNSCMAGDTEQTGGTGGGHGLETEQERAARRRKPAQSAQPTVGQRLQLRVRGKFPEWWKCLC